MEDESLSTTTALAFMDPYKDEELMRFTATLSYKGLSSKADTLIDTKASLHFVNKEIIMANGFYKDCKTLPKLYIRVANEHRISTTKIFSLAISTIDGHELTDLQVRDLPRFKGSDIIQRLPALKKLNVVIHLILNSFTLGNFTIQCDRESRSVY